MPKRLPKKVKFEIEEGTQDQTVESFSVLNFYEVISPPPNYPCFKDGFLRVAEVMSKHKQLVFGALLKDVDSDSLFPYVAYDVYSASGFNEIHHQPEMIEAVVKGYGHQQIHHRSAYSEVETIWNGNVLESEKTLEKRKPPNSNRVYILSAFKVQGNLSSLEQNWEQWSGANYIINSASSSLKHHLRRLSFFKRLSKYGTFQFVMLSEFAATQKSLFHMKELSAVLSDRFSGYSACYGVDEILPLIIK